MKLNGVFYTMEASEKESENVDYRLGFTVCDYKNNIKKAVKINAGILMLFSI